MTYKPENIKVALLFSFDPVTFSILRHFGIAEKQTASWNPGKISKKGISKLLTRADVLKNDEIPIVDIYINYVEKVEPLNIYFETSFKDAFEKMGIKGELDPSNFVIVFNLMPFLLSTTIIDKILQGLFHSIADISLLKDVPFVFLTRNIDWFTKSEIFKGSLAKKKIRNSFFLVDIRGYSASFQKGKSLQIEIPRSIFLEVLNITDKGVRMALIYQTNISLGHFELKNSHIRTHYDLSDFVLRDDVSEYLCDKVSHVIQDYQRVIIIGVGLEQKALMHLMYQFKIMNSDRVREVVDFFEDRSVLRKRIKELIEETDCIIILSDIVNTGATLSTIIQDINQILQGKVPIKLFTIVRMINSPEIINENYQLDAAITIKREYYPADEKKCPLCQLDQPLKTVEKIHDFHYTDAAQLTPFDFWEIVEDCKALERSRVDPQGREFLYRINTIRIISRYGNWLKNVIRSKCDLFWPHYKPNVILTVKEAAGAAFSELVSTSLDIDDVVAVERSEVRKASPSSGLTKEQNPFSAGRTRVLIVDDGINYGLTLEQLIYYCRAGGIIPLGALVFDSRLKSTQTEKLQLLMGGNRIVALYTWPSTPVSGTIEI